MSYVTNLYRQPMCHIRHSRRRRIIKVVFLLIMLLPSLGAFADKYDLSRMTINSWSSLSNDSLFKTADGFMATQPSKGLVCFSILANRYYTGPQSRHDMYLYAKAFYFLQSCYTLYFFDFQKATSNIVMAEQIAKENGFDDLLSYIYMGQGNLYLMNSFVTGDKVSLATSIDNFTKAFEASKRNKVWSNVAFSVLSLIQCGEEFGQWKMVQPVIDSFEKEKVPDNEIMRFAKAYCNAYLLFFGNRYHESIAAFDKAASMSLPAQYKLRLSLMAIISKAYIYTGQKEYDNARAAYQDALDKERGHNDVDILYTIYGRLLEVCKLQGDTAATQNYSAKASQYKGYLLAQAHVGDVRYLPMMRRLEQMNAEAKATARWQYIMHVVIISLLSLLVIGGIVTLWLLRRYRQVSRDNERLYQENVAMLCAEEERKRAEKEQASRQPKHQVAEGEKEDLAVRIRYVMDNSAEIYKPDFSVRRLAELADGKYWEVSQTINDTFKKNFNRLLAEYRISEACRRMNDRTTYGQLTLEAIALGVGFKSRTNFSKVFNEVTGLTPSTYLRLARKDSEERALRDATASVVVSDN